MNSFTGSVHIGAGTSRRDAVQLRVQWVFEPAPHEERSGRDTVAETVRLQDDTVSES